MNLYEEMYGMEQHQIFYGKESIRVPMHMVVQDHAMVEGEQVVSFVGACRYKEVNPMMFGSLLPHVRVHGQLIISPYSVVETNSLEGAGFAGIVRSPFFAGEKDILDRRIIDKGLRI